MASLQLTSGVNQFSWSIIGLGAAFSTANGYTEAGIATSSFTSGATTRPSGIVSTITPPSTSTSTSTSTKTVSYSPGTYTFYAYTKVQDGKYWSAGSATVTVSGQKPVEAGSITIQNITEDSVTISLSAIPYATGYHILWRRNYDSYYDEVNTTSRTYTISGLLSGYSYTVNYYGYNSYGIGPYMSVGKTFTTKQPVVAYGSLSIKNVSSSTATVELSPIQYATSYTIYLERRYDGYQEAVVTSDLEYTFTGLLPGISYGVNYKGINSDGSGPQMPSDVIFTTDNLITTYGSMQIVTRTSSSVTIQMSSITNAESYYVIYRNVSTGEENSITTSNLTITIYRLSANTTYIFNYRGVDVYGAFGPYMPSGVSTTTKVAAWSWSLSNGSASLAQTSAAYNAIISNGKCNAFNCLVWNDMVDKAVEIISARGAEWNNDYGTAAESKITSTNKILTAKKFNALWWNLSHFITVSGAKKAVTGEKVYGSYFIALTSAMNAIIP